MEKRMTVRSTRYVVAHATTCGRLQADTRGPAMGRTLSTLGTPARSIAPRTIAPAFAPTRIDGFVGDVGFRSGRPPV